MLGKLFSYFFGSPMSVVSTPSTSSMDEMNSYFFIKAQRAAHTHAIPWDADVCQSLWGVVKSEIEPLGDDESKKMLMDRVITVWYHPEVFLKQEKLITSLVYKLSEIQRERFQLTLNYREEPVTENQEAYRGVAVQVNHQSFTVELPQNASFEAQFDEQLLDYLTLQTLQADVNRSSFQEGSLGKKIKTVWNCNVAKQFDRLPQILKEFAGQSHNSISIKNHHYIASGLPRGEAFWGMCLKEKPQAIVQLAPGRYYPPKEGQITHFHKGVLSVSTLSVEKIGLVAEKRIIEIKDHQSTHQLTHWYFSAWPDMSTPKPQDFHEFYKRFSADRTPHDKTVVHCLGGIGRTGTFLAIDILSQEPEMNPFSLVVEMRKQRPFSMIETKAQFLFALAYVSRV
jgi:Protein tyrosine phosphatase